MQVTLLGSARASSQWIDLGQSNGEYFSLYAEFDLAPYANSRLVYIREVFGPNQYSARWIRLWLRHGETHVFRALDFAGYNRLFQMRSEWVNDFRVDFYEVEPGIISQTPTQPGVQNEYYNNDVLVYSEVTLDIDYDYGTNGTPHHTVGSPYTAVHKGYIEIPVGTGITFDAQGDNRADYIEFEIGEQLTGIPMFAGDKRQLKNDGPYLLTAGQNQFRLLYETTSKVRLKLRWIYGDMTGFATIPPAAFTH